MALFSSKKSTTNLSTTNVFTDQSANAGGDGSLAVGAGANVNIETADKEIVEAALASNLGTTQAAMQTAGLALAANQNTSLGALAANQNVTVAALGSGERTAQLSIKAQNELAGLALRENAALAETTVNTVKGLSEVASRERLDVLRTTETALQSTRGANDKLASLASAALERSQTPDSAVTKTLLYVVGGVAALGVLFLLGRRRAAA